MVTTQTAEDVRNQLGAFLTKPLQITSGTLSTQQTSSVTSVGEGGVQGRWVFGPNGSIQMFDSVGNLSIYIGFEDL